MANMKSSLKNRILQLLEEDEFGDSLKLFEKNIYDDLAEDIGQNVDDSISNDNLRTVIRDYFERYSDVDINDFDVYMEKKVADNPGMFGMYDEVIDNFLQVLSSLNIKESDKDQIFKAVADISNSRLYYFMLIMSISDAIYNNLEKEAADKIMYEATQSLNKSTDSIITNIENGNIPKNTRNKSAKTAKKDKIFNSRDNKVISFSKAVGNDK